MVLMKVVLTASAWAELMVGKMVEMSVGVRDF